MLIDLTQGVRYACGGLAARGSRGSEEQHGVPDPCRPRRLWQGLYGTEKYKRLHESTNTLLKKRNIETSAPDASRSSQSWVSITPPAELIADVFTIVNNLVKMLWTTGGQQWICRHFLREQRRFVMIYINKGGDVDRGENYWSHTFDRFQGIVSTIPFRVRVRRYWE